MNHSKTSSLDIFAFLITVAAGCDGQTTTPVRDAGDAGVHDAQFDARDATEAGSDAFDAGRDAATNLRNPLGLGPARVELGSETDLAAAGSYVLMAKTGITNVTGSSIVGGNVGLSPASAAFITGFALTADPSNVFSTSPSVPTPGKIFASNYAVPTPPNLTVAVLSMQAAYSDAASRTEPDFLNHARGAIGGLTLVPGLYTWGTSVNVSEDLILAGGPDDIWIFQVSNDLDVSAAKSMLFTGGARARNVFWQVAGQVTIHATAHFEGVILCQTGITLQTLASMRGRAFSQSLLALDNNTITAP